MILADLTLKEGIHIGAEIAAMLVIFFMWRQTRDKTRTKIENDPLKVEVSKRKARASEEDCKARHGALVTMLEKFKEWVVAKFDATEKDHDTEHRRIYGRIEEVHGEVSAEIKTLSNKVAGLEKETENQNGWLARIDEKLDTLIRRS